MGEEVAVDTQKDGPFELVSYRLGALPLVNHYWDRIGLDALLARWLPGRDRRFRLDPAVAIRLVVVNLLVGRTPLYGLGEWATPFAPVLLGLADADDVAWLNDDRIGRALQKLFEADRASLLTELIVGVVGEFGVDTSELHNDSTSVSVHGAYRSADGTPRGGKPTAAVTFGHSKDHRPDLKQLVWILTVSADGRCRWRTGSPTATPATTPPTCPPGTSWSPCWVGATSSTSPTPSWPQERRCATSTQAVAGSSPCYPAPGPRTGGSATGPRPTSHSGPKRSAYPAPGPTSLTRCTPPSPPRCPRPRATASSGCTAAPRPPATPPHARPASRPAPPRSTPSRPSSPAPPQPGGSPLPSPRRSRRPSARSVAAGPAPTPAIARPAAPGTRSAGSPAPR